MNAMHLHNFELKTQPKQLLGYVPSGIELHGVEPSPAVVQFGTTPTSLEAL